eukprot:UN14084
MSMTQRRHQLRGLTQTECIPAMKICLRKQM